MKNTLLYITLLLFVLGCKKDEPIGPNLESLYADLELTKPFAHNRPNGASFGLGDSVKFTAEFNVSLDWKVEITGINSGAKKTISGFGNTLNNPITFWTGESDNIFFREEKCTVLLSFKNFEEIFSDTVIINSTINYANSGVLIEDFDSGFDGTDGASPSSFATVFDFNNTIQAAEGTTCYEMSGDEPGSSYYLGNLYFKNFSPNIQTGKTNDQVYFNMFVKGMNLPGTKLIIKILEDEDGDGIKDETWEYEYLPEGNEWNKMSFSLDSLTLADPASDGIFDNSKILQININLNTNGAASSSSPSHGAFLDFPILTYDKPL